MHVLLTVRKDKVRSFVSCLVSLLRKTGLKSKTREGSFVYFLLLKNTSTYLFLYPLFLFLRRRDTKQKKKKAPAVCAEGTQAATFFLRAACVPSAHRIPNKRYWLPPFSFLLMRVFLRVVYCAQLPSRVPYPLEKKRKEPLKEKGSTQNQRPLRDTKKRGNSYPLKEKKSPLKEKKRRIPSLFFVSLKGRIF